VSEPRGSAGDEATAAPPVHQIPRTAGLCALCIHARAIVSNRGSVFVLCEAAASDPLLERYPRLPVHDCHGFTARPRDDHPVIAT
jgi:hypothetical protein